MAHVFISYHKNSSRAYARKLADHLIAGGFDVWIDDRINLGSSWSDEIFKAIKTCGAFIVIMTPGAETSEWVKREYLNAERYKKPQFPLLLEGENFPYYTPVQYTDVRGGTLPGADFLDALVAAGAARKQRPGVEIAGAAQEAAQRPSPPAPLPRKRGEGRPWLFPVMLLAVVVAAAALIAPRLPTSEPSTPTITYTPSVLGGGRGQIAFNSNRDGNDEVYVMNADGSNQHNLTNHSAGDYHPTWSPDGRSITFYSNRDGNDEIYVMANDGSHLRRLTNDDASDRAPAWSPTGMQIVFYSDRDGNWEIYVMDFDGANPQRLTNHSADDWLPTWSPDGTQILFCSARDGNLEIYVMNADGTDQRRLTNDSGYDAWPVWSPDETHIAFYSNRDGNWDLYTMNADGSNVRSLTNGGADFDPAWSPDGTHIAFTSERDGNREIYVIAADGSNVRNLTNDSAWDWYASWRP